MNNQEKTIISPERPSNGAVFPMPPQQDFLGLGTPQDDNTLKEILSSIQRRILPIVGVASLVMSGFVYSYITADKIYQGGFQIVVEPLTNQSESLALPVGFTQPSLDYSSQIEVLVSPVVIKPALTLIQSSFPGLDYSSLVSRLSIERLGTKKIIAVTYRGSDLKEIDLVLKTLSQFYLKYGLEKRKITLSQGLNFLNSQLPENRNRFNKLQKQLELFRKQYRLLDPETKYAELLKQGEELKSQNTQIQERLSIAKLNYSNLLTPQGQKLALKSAPIYDQLRQLDAQILSQLARLQPDHPSIQTLEEKKEELLPIIADEERRYIRFRLDETANLIKSLDLENQKLSRAQAVINTEIEKLPDISRQYILMQRELQFSTETLNRILQYREQLLNQTAQTQVPWELTQPPYVSQVPILPNTSQDLSRGIIVSLIAGAAIGFLLEKLDNTYHRPTNLEQKTKLPLLGTLPNTKKLLSYQARHQLKTQETESPLTRRKKSKAYGYGYYGYGYGGEGRFFQALQVLYANIQLLNSDQIVKSITVSSSVKSEGKTTIAARLAEVAASMGKRVLLVDCDLRLPRVHKELELPNLVGLSSVITSNLPVQEAMQNLPDLPTLSVMTSGTQPPDPMRLISSDKMKQIMTYFRENFDLVIYDTPPLTSIVDAKLLAAQTDGLLLVVRMHKTDRSAVAQVLESLKQSSISVLGVVANRYKKNGGSGEYNYYYNYGSYTSTKPR